MVANFDWEAINEAYLAEAEGFAQVGLRREEVVPAYCLIMLGHVRRAQRRFAEAERYCRAAVAFEEERQDLWALGPGGLALRETYRDAGRVDEAYQAF